jgi:thiosulfate/3-mercaptopyruvate sulfurtransferase
MTEERKTPPLVSAQWLAEHRDDLKVRVVEIAGTGQEEKQKYNAGHIPGAVCWWWKDALWDTHMRDFPAPDAFARLCAENGISNDTTVVFYGEGIQFGVYAWWAFTYCGHDRAAVLDGGRYRWVKEGRELTRDVPALPRARYEAQPRRDAMRITYRDVLRGLDRADRVLLDGRSPEEYKGQRVNTPEGPDVGAVRYGRIPGAKHIYFERLLNEDKTFRTLPELRSLFEAAGAMPDKETVAYCRMSHRATVLYFALTRLLGYDGVRVYDGSWTEWGNMVGVPVER